MDGFFSGELLQAARTRRANARNKKSQRKASQRALGARPMIDITADAIELYLRARLRSRVRIRTGNGHRETTQLKATTVHQEVRVLRRMLNVDVRKKFLTCK